MNTFEQTIEEYREEVMSSCDNMTMEEFYSLELELDNLTVELYKESNNIEAIKLANNDLSLKALAIANGVHVNNVNDFTIESSKDSLVKRLWERLKLLIKKARMFIAKWVSKALVLFTKNEETRANYAEELNELNSNILRQLPVPKTFLSGIKNMIGMDGDRANTSFVNNMLTFYRPYYIETDSVHASEEEDLRMFKFRLRDYTDFETKEEIIKVSKLTGDLFSVITMDDEGEENIHITKFNKKTMDNIYETIKEKHSFSNIYFDKHEMVRQLRMTKKEMQTNINETYDVFKKKDVDSKDIKSIQRASQNISYGIITIKGIVSKVSAATAIYEYIDKNADIRVIELSKDMEKGRMEVEAKDIERKERRKKEREEYEKQQAIKDAEYAERKRKYEEELAKINARGEAIEKEAEARKEKQRLKKEAFDKEVATYFNIGKKWFNKKIEGFDKQLLNDAELKSETETFNFNIPTTFSGKPMLSYDSYLVAVDDRINTNKGKLLLALDNASPNGNVDEGIYTRISGDITFYIHDFWREELSDEERKVLYGHLKLVASVYYSHDDDYKEVVRDAPLHEDRYTKVEQREIRMYLTILNKYFGV